MTHIAAWTRLNIKQDIVRHFALRDDVAFRPPVPVTSSGTISGGSLVDTRLGLGTTDANAYDGYLIEFLTNGALAAVDNAGFDGTSTLTYSPDVGGGTQYIMYPRDLTPEIIHEGIDEVLRNTEGEHVWLPSLVPDADLDDGTYGNNWTDVGTPSTGGELVTVAANVFLGPRSLHYIADAAGEGIRSASFSVTENEMLNIWVTSKANVGSSQIVLYNVSAGSNLRPVTHDEPDWTTVRFNEPVADNMELAQIRMLSAAASDDVFISAFVTVQSASERSYDAPSWLMRQEQILRAVRWEPGVVSEEDDSYLALSGRMREVQPPELLRSDLAVHPAKVRLKGTTIGDPIALIVMREFDPLATDSTTTHCNREFVVQKTIANIKTDRGELDAVKFHRRAARIARVRGYGQRAIRMSDPRVRVGHERFPVRFPVSAR